MKMKILAVFVAISCVACSGEEFQLDLEKADVDKSEPVNARSNIDEATLKKAVIENGSNKPGTVSLELADRTAFVQSEGSESNDANRAVSDSSASFKSGTNLDIEKTTTDDSGLMRELEASLAAVDDAELMTRYASKGSVIDLALGGSDLTNGSIALVVSKRSLVSNVTSVSGATSITGDPTGFGFTIGLSGDYLFEFDKDTLTPKAQAALESVLTLYKDYAGTNIKVVGHTDAKGSNDYNLDLSKRRASSVKEWFKTAGIDASLLTTKGYGETKPVAENTKNGKDHPEGRALNRRVEIVVKTKKKVNHLPTVSKPSSL